jgi:peptidoglycan/xylan/chitin deacetylase (PgdA/CDA1 family)
VIGRLLHRARRARGILEARALGGSVVLLYHRVAEPNDGGRGDPFSLCVSPARFAEHLEVLRGFLGRPSLPLEALVDGGVAVGAGRRGARSTRGVAITFDDGYADNLHAALPLLERHECPATLFATTDSPGREFWWDAMARLNPEDATALLAELEGRPPVAAVEGATTGRLHARLLRVEPSERRELLEARAGSGGGDARALDTGELARMAASGLVTIGGHTHTHADLGTLDPEAQLLEIRTNRLELERITGTRPHTFAYPFGRFANFSRATTNLLRQEGFRVACTAEPGVVRRGTGPLRVPRLWVENWTGDEFERRLGRWMA